MLVVVAALLAVGAVTVQSAGMVVTRDTSLADLATDRTVLLAAAAMIALLLGRMLPARWLSLPSVAIVPIAVAIVLLLLVHVPGIGREVNGARRWIDIGPLGFQPSEVAKWGCVIFAAWWLSRPRTNCAQPIAGLAPLLVVSGLACGLILLEDLGTAVLIGAVVGVMLLAAGARMRHLAALVVPAAGVVVAAIVAAPYRMRRLEAFLDPWADPTDTGYHVIQSMAALSGGGIGGRGLGNSIQKFGYLPEDTTDFIFAIITEEMGLIGAVLVVGLFGGLIWAGWRITRRAMTRHTALLALGVTTTVGLQAVMNLLVVTGMAPTKGIALPLVSSGGTGWIATAFMLGLISGSDRHDGAHTTTAAAPSLAGVAT